jgi:polar amino acid transport system substrate-binding protein
MLEVRALRDKQIPLLAYNTYLNPPFLFNSVTGLAPDFVDYLNQKLGGSYHFKLVNLPRVRLTRIVVNDPGRFKDIALFLTPQFAGDEGQQKFLWPSPIYTDHNVLIFRGPSAPAVATLKDLESLKFGGIAENRYAGLDAMFEKKLLTREDAPTELSNLRKLKANRIDFTLMSRMYFVFFSNQDEFRDQFVTLPYFPMESFARRILVGRANPKLAAQLDAAIKAMPFDDQWAAIAEKYHLEVKQEMKPAE